MKFNVNANRVFGIRDIKLYGHFIEHFHRQIYGGVYDPASPLADEDGFRTDVIEAMKKIKTPILRCARRMLCLILSLGKRRWSEPQAHV